MFSGRFSQYPRSLVVGVVRRTYYEESCSRVLLSTYCQSKSKKISSNIINLRCKQRFYSSKDLDFQSRMAARPSTTLELPPKHTNRLIDSKSPYLLQHAHNPVDWYPWGEDAFEKARKEDKLIFLSVGYSTCHWCHVMERESFENEDIANIMNKHFVNVKVDREERPDVDKVYMTFVQVCSGSGGWPMSVFLKPDLKPVFGGTYFPPEDKYGRRGFKSELLKWAKEWKENKTQWTRIGESVIEVLRKATVFEVPMAENLISGMVPGAECWDLCADQLVEHYEPSYGGFSLAPKFPQPAILRFILHLCARDPTNKKASKLKDMALHTLNKMAQGGIHDHINQGFARYSTDMKWHVPHFEKMLYDQAQLAVVYSSAYQLTKNPLYRDIVIDILTYVSRDLSHKSGGFYSAEDADSYPSADSKEKVEGAFCVWTHQEISKLLSRPVVGSTVTLAQLFCHHYNVRPQGNVSPDQDPHKELVGQNVLMEVSSVAQTAVEFKLEEEVIKSELAVARHILRQARLARPRPHLDNKILTSWNGLMISGYAKASEALQDESLTERAVEAAEFIKSHLYRSDTNTLLRSCYTTEQGDVAQISTPIEGFLDDYAFLIQGLLDLYESSLEVRWLEWADQLQVKQDQLFWDIASAGYFSTTHSSNLILRLKEDQDGAEPSGNSVSCMNLLRLAAMLERNEYREKAGKLLASFTSRLSNIPMALPELSSALIFFHDSPTQVTITGKVCDEDTARLLSVVRSRLIPSRVLVLADGDEASLLYRSSETMRRMKSVDGRQSAYVCRGRTCSLPVHTPHDLAALLDKTSS